MRVGTVPSAAIGAARQDDVLVITLGGEITGRTYGMVLERASREVSERTVRAVVIDITRAAPLSEWADGWQSSEDFCRAHCLPCGLVIPRRMAAPINRQCFRVAALGITWVAFLRLNEALLWASSWSAHALSWPHQQPRCEDAEPPVLH